MKRPGPGGPISGQIASVLTKNRGYIGPMLAPFSRLTTVCAAAAVLVAYSAAAQTPATDKPGDKPVAKPVAQPAAKPAAKVTTTADVFPTVGEDLLNLGEDDIPDFLK